MTAIARALLPFAPSTATALVAVVPVFNEAERALAVLDGLHARGISPIYIVNDGSTDGSGALIDEWVARHGGARAIHLPENRGKSAALRAVWDALRVEVDAGRLAPDAWVLGVDGGGQHDLRYIDDLIAHAEAHGLDAVIARRDLSYHGWYKRLGNLAMTVLGSLAAGQRLQDIECGYRLIRARALVDAQRFYRGHRYSEAVELVVVLARLGYRVDNTFEVRVPNARTRTHLSDAAKHVFAMFGAWYRVALWRDVPTARRSRFAVLTSAIVLLAFACFLGAIQSKSFYISNDSAHSYAHVWFLERAIFVDHWIPLRMPNLEAGQAFTFPYGLIPWLPTALVRPLLGDRAVTLSLIVGVLAMVAGVWHWLPRLRSPLLTAILLLNPQLYGGLAQFQLPTFWALAMAFFAAGEFTRGRSVRGTAFAVAALYAHPLTGVAALGLTILANAESQRRIPTQQIVCTGIAVILGAPALWMLVSTPLVDEVGYAALLIPVWLTMKRVSLVGWAWALNRFMPQVVRSWPLVFLVALGVVLNDVRHAPPVGLWESSQPRFADVIAAGRIQPDVTYRALTTTRHEDGLLELMQAGARLGHEFFDESVWRYSFGTTQNYRCFLQEKRVDRVLISGEWAALDWNDERRLLERMADEGVATRTFRGDAGTLEYTLKPGAEIANCGPRVKL